MAQAWLGTQVDRFDAALALLSRPRAMDVFKELGCESTVSVD